VTARSGPSVAVVVTAHNYGHFLGVCLDSLLDQTAPADEIVVVDDGSTDDSAAILRGYGDRIRVLACENGGQAAAFARGFAGTAADLVLFLDADDLLLPHALEVVRLAWSPGLASLVFALETVGAAGESRGPYPGPGAAPLADSRPDLLRTGSYASSPTSGNVFARAFLQQALPMPEGSWRISADCYLVRAAALYGRIGSVRTPLGQYRMHFANNYAQLGAGGWEEGLHVANRADTVRALIDLAAAPDGLLGPAAATVRAALTERAALIEIWGDDHVGRPFAGFDDVLRPRWPPVLEADRVHLLSEAPAIAACCLRGPETTEIDLRLPAATGPLAVELALDDAAGAGAALHLDGELAAECPPWQARASLSLPRAPFDPDRRVRVVVTGRAGGPPPAILAVRVTSGRAARHAPLLRAMPEPAAAILRPGLDSGAWRPTAMQGLALVGPEGGFAIAGPGRAGARLVLELGEPVPPGFLEIEADGAPVFAGRVGTAARIAVSLPPGAAPVTCRLRFAPDDPEIARPFVLAAVSTRPPAVGALPVSLGEVVALSGDPVAGEGLGAGWLRPGGGAPQTEAAEAALTLDLPPGAEDVVLELDLVPLLAPPEGVSLVVGLSRDGAMLAQAALLGPGTFAVPLGTVTAPGRVALTLHSVLVEGGEAAFAPVELSRLRVLGRLEGGGRPLARPLARPPAFERLLARIRAALDAPAPGNREDLAACRAEQVARIAEGGAATPLLLLGDAGRAATLVALALATEGIPPSRAETDALAGGAREDGAAGRFAASLAEMLLRPAWRHGAAGDLAALPPPFLAVPEAIADWLAAPGGVETEAEHGAWRAYLRRLLDGIRAALEEGPDTGRLYPLAAATLRRLRMTRMIFADADVTALAGLQSRAIEGLLTREGAPLARPPAIREGLTRLRVGVLVRDVTATPEGWALRGMYDGLDPGRFDCVLIRMAEAGEPAPERFAETLCLAGMTLAASVEAIRALELDLFVTGAYARDMEIVTAIYAHRLAPLQIWHSAVCPTTSGLRSFDAALTCPATEPEWEAAQALYHEPLHRIDASAAPCAYAIPPIDGAARDAVRADLGLGDGEAMLVSAALAHKITDRTLAAWARILAEAPAAVLVLAPFAPNWSMPADPGRFAARLTAAGLPEDRVTICPAMPPERLRSLVAAADLMLDSFPYSGATTVCEALSVGVPVVARAGRALRQLTGAGWVRRFGLDDLVAGDDDGYVATAARLARDADARAAVAARLARAAAADPPPHDDRAGYGAAYGRALWTLAERSGRFPGLAPATPPDAVFRPTRMAPAPGLALRPVRPRLLAILTSPRTGSTLLCARLNRTPGILCHYELFHADMIQFAEATETDAEARAARDADPAAFLETVRADAARRGARIAGFKHFDHLDRTVTRLVIEDPDTLLIHLSRANLLAQYASERIAQGSGEWVHHEGDPGGPDRRAVFDPGDFQRFLRYQRRVETERVTLFAEAGRRPLFLDYAGLASAAARDRIGAYLGVLLPADARTDIVKRGGADILSRFTEPEAVAAFLAAHDLYDWAREG
jgi:LPS sulfotransferase NodH